jgi:chemotaxis protein histidine kinase CheA
MREFPECPNCHRIEAGLQIYECRECGKFSCLECASEDFACPICGADNRHVREIGVIEDSEAKEKAKQKEKDEQEKEQRNTHCHYCGMTGFLVDFHGEKFHQPCIESFLQLEPGKKWLKEQEAAEEEQRVAEEIRIAEQKKKEEEARKHEEWLKTDEGKAETERQKREQEEAQEKERQREKALFITAKKRQEKEKRKEEAARIEADRLQLEKKQQEEQKVKKEHRIDVMFTLIAVVLWIVLALIYGAALFTPNLDIVQIVFCIVLFVVNCAIINYVVMFWNTCTKKGGVIRKILFSALFLFVIIPLAFLPVSIVQSMVTNAQKKAQTEFKGSVSSVIENGDTEE